MRRPPSALCSSRFDRAARRARPAPSGRGRWTAAIAALAVVAAALIGSAAPAQAQNKFSSPGNGVSKPNSRGAVVEFEPTPPLPRIGSGTGFYVNATDMVTNAHVVETCRSMRDPQGRRLRLVQIDHQLDLALLRSDASTDEWLLIAAPEPLRLGSGVYVMGFPFYGQLGNSVIVTRGVVSSRSGYLGRRTNFGLTAPIQPGNSGGPVLDAQGRVVGVAVARLENLRSDPDSLPQNVNFAVSHRALNDFLTRSGADFQVSADPVADLSNGVPIRFEKSVAAVLCD